MSSKTVLFVYSKCIFLLQFSLALSCVNIHIILLFFPKKEAVTYILKGQVLPYVVWSFKSWKPIRSICCLCLPIDYKLCLSGGACFWGHTCCGSMFLLNAKRNCIYILWNWDLGTRIWNLESKMCLTMLHSVPSNQSWVFWVARYYPRETSLLFEWIWKKSNANGRAVQILF